MQIKKNSKKMKNIYDVFQTMPNIAKARHFEYFFGNEIPNKSPKVNRTPLTVISPDTNEEINIEIFSKYESEIEAKRERKILQILNPITKVSIDLENTKSTRKISLTGLKSDKESKILSNLNLPKNHPFFDDCFEFLPTIYNEELTVIPKENKPKIKKSLLPNFPESFKTTITEKNKKNTLEIINPHTKQPIQIKHLSGKKYNSNLTIQDPITKEKFDLKRIKQLHKSTPLTITSPVTLEPVKFGKTDDSKTRKILPVINPLTKEKINIEEYIAHSDRMQFEQKCRINLNGIEYPHCDKHSQINEENIINLLKDVEDCLCGATLIISKDDPKSFQTFLNDKEIPKSNLTIFLRDGTVKSNFNKNEDDRPQLLELNNYKFCDNTLLVVYPATREPIFIDSQCFNDNTNI